MAGQGNNLYPIAGQGQKVVLPRGARVVRVVSGDSIAGVLNCTRTGLSQRSMRSDLADTVIQYRPNARYWSRWYCQDAGANWTILERTRTATSGTPYSPNLYSWLPLNDHVGWRAPTVVADLTTGPDIPLAWLIDYWAERFLGRYVDITGAPVGVDYIIASHTGSGVAATVASPGPSTSITNTWDPVVVDGVYDQFVEYGYKPAVNALLLESRAELAALADPATRVGPASNHPQGVVFVESMLFTAGGQDTATLSYAQSLGANIQRRLNQFEIDMGGKVPTILLRPFTAIAATLPYHAEAKVSFDAQFGEFGDGPLDWIQLEGCSLQEETEYTVFPGIHPNANGASLMARRICDAINRMAARNQTLLPITAALS